MLCNFPWHTNKGHFCEETLTWQDVRQIHSNFYLWHSKQKGVFREKLKKKDPTIAQSSNQKQIFTITDLVQRSCCNLQRWSPAQRVELSGTVPWTPAPVRACCANLFLLWTTIPSVLWGSTSQTLCSFEVTVQVGFSNVIVPQPCFDDSEETDVSWKILFLADTWLSPKHAYIYQSFQAVPAEYALPPGG